jgi:nicotinamidase-related amidase
MNNSALVLIDLLNDFFEDQRLAGRRRDLVSATNQLVRTFRQNHQPIIWIRQEFKPDLSDAFLEMRRHNIRITIAGTEGAQILRELDVQPVDTVLTKKRYSGFFHTRLDEVLAASRPDVLVIGGINTHACVRATVIDAYQRDYEVIVASECTASYDNEHHEVTKRYLDDKIARFLSNSEIHAMLASNNAAS